MLLAAHIPLVATHATRAIISPPRAAEQCPTYGGFVHYGATSQDINDTVTALQLQECKAVLLSATADVRRELTRLAGRYRDTATIGRTHGQHAIPITMGFKFANYLYEVSVAEAFLARVDIVAKFSGAVGTFASLGTSAVQASIMAQLGLTPAPISTQVSAGLRGLRAGLRCAGSARAAPLPVGR